MRISLYLFCLIFISISVHAQQVRWMSWDDGVKKAKNTNKIIMIDAVRDGCGYCIRMERAVFQDSNMARYIQKHFVPVKINLSHESMPMDLKVVMTPSFFFFTPKKEKIKVIIGSWNKTDFRELLGGVIQKDKR